MIGLVLLSMISITLAVDELMIGVKVLGKDQLKKAYYVEGINGACRGKRFYLTTDKNLRVGDDLLVLIDSSTCEDGKTYHIKGGLP
ncbi:hypothetical protein [Thermocrinis minervae]|uniref:Uncharacterized protein n=1 Tax=Thermocrinis minervae TaxID=381751 RepID=A0A1M6Q1F1_9AQUI|nr:hypothetical protein [Thermocrinis minervae]SHK13957.1 hypothetical protein SAMN05444391_0037 [Thermocrinis minervae]